MAERPDLEGIWQEFQDKGHVTRRNLRKMLDYVRSLERAAGEREAEITRLQVVCADRHDALILVGCDQIELAQLRHQLGAAREALEGVRRLTNLLPPSEQTGPEWERCVRVPLAWLAQVDNSLDAVLGDQPVTNEPLPTLHPDAPLAAPARAEGEG